MKRMLLVLFILPMGGAAAAQPMAVPFPFEKGDRVAWIGSSSTKIGVWPKTMEYLLNTRHPELKLSFKSFTTGGGTFATGLQNLDKWLGDFKPTLVFFNYGGNDAGAGAKGLPQFQDNIEKAVAKVRGTGARVLLLTPQAADVRKSGEAGAARRKLYAESMLTFGKDKGWPTVDIYHPLENLQLQAQKADDKYTILRDTIHLTEPAYIAWGYFLYERLTPLPAASTAHIGADGKVIAAVRCRIEDVMLAPNRIAFTRLDATLPLLPPVPLPPRAFVPLETFSPYRLQITGLADGNYEIYCEQKRIGTTDAAALKEGVNLNSLLLNSKEPAPWESLAKQLWAGKNLEQIGTTRWRFHVRKSQ